MLQKVPSLFRFVPLLPFAAFGEVTVIGPLIDGSPPPPSEPEKAPDVEVRETVTRSVGERDATIHRIADPSPSTPPLRDQESVVIEDQEGRAPAPLATVAQGASIANLVVSATVVDGYATYLRWWHEGSEYRAWSHADWRLLTGFSQFEKDGERFSLLLMASSVQSSSLPNDSIYRIPSPFPTVGNFQLLQGDPSDSEAIEGMAALHELYVSEYDRLAQARNIRLQNAAAREAAEEERRNKDDGIVLHYWKVQPEEGAKAKGGSQ